MKKLLKHVRTLAIVCLQWGDSGKGKFVDFFADWADIIARGTGGANAGHTIKAEGQEMIFHLVPSGLMRENKINIIGSGVVLDPRTICEELDVLKQHDIEYRDRLFIANNAKLILPHHLALDRLRDLAKNGRIGTTGRGIGPAYEDHYRRTGLVVADLLNSDSFVRKLALNLEETTQLFRGYDPEAVKTVMAHKHLGEGRFYSANDFFVAGEIAEAYLEWGSKLAPMIRDTDSWLRGEVGQKRILLEGAQGTLLSVDYGTYPFVTASDASLAGLAKGVGLLSSQVDLTLGMVKAPYITRVGEGSFPTEMGGAQSNEWCGSKAASIARADGFKSVRALEADVYDLVTLDESDEFKFGIAVRIAGDEYGATTGRPRRTGWLDLPLLRYAKQFNGPDVILTKLDVLSRCPIIKICVAYKYDGPNHWVDGEDFLTSGKEIQVAIPADEVLRHCRPIYRKFPGWRCDISQMKSVDELPLELMKIIEFIGEEAGVKARVLSVGPDREQTIFRE